MQGFFLRLPGNFCFIVERFIFQIGRQACSVLRHARIDFSLACSQSALGLGDFVQKQLAILLIECCAVIQLLAGILQFLLGFRKFVFALLQFIFRISDLPLTLRTDFIDALQRSPVQSKLHFIGQSVHLFIIGVRVACFRHSRSHRQISFRIDAAENIRFGYDNESIQAALPDIGGTTHYRFDVHRRINEADDRVFLFLQGDAVFFFFITKVFVGLMAESDGIADLISTAQILFRIQGDFAACFRQSAVY